MSCKKHVFKTKIIKEYDIRGEFKTDLAESDAYFLGCSLGTYIKIKLSNQKYVLVMMAEKVHQC